MAVPHSEQPHPTPTEPQPDAADQAAFFARLEAELAETDAEPEPAWKARTFGHFVLNPQAYRSAMASCIAVIVLATGWIGYSWKHSQRPLDGLNIPPGYHLISTADGQIVAVRDECATTPEDEALRAAALNELQQLLAKPSGHYAADGLAVTASAGQ